MADAMKVDEAKALEVAWQAARLGGHEALRARESGLEISRKSDGTLVTQGDQNAEKIIRKELLSSFPDIPVLGEEQGGDIGNSAWAWYVDPIDATKNYIRGLPLFGVLIALVHDQSPRIGVIYCPAFREGFRARQGAGCIDEKGQIMQVSKVSQLKEGFMCHGAIDRILEAPYAKGFEKMAHEVHAVRGFGDFYGHSWVIRGSADVMIDPVVNPWDVAAIKICVEEAGGRFTDLDGKDTFLGGSGLSTNGILHPKVLSYIEKGD